MHCFPLQGLVEGSPPLGPAMWAWGGDDMVADRYNIKKNRIIHVNKKRREKGEKASRCKSHLESRFRREMKYAGLQKLYGNGYM